MVMSHVYPNKLYVYKICSDTNWMFISVTPIQTWTQSSGFESLIYSQHGKIYLRFNVGKNSECMFSYYTLNANTKTKTKTLTFSEKIMHRGFDDFGKIFIMNEKFIREELWHKFWNEGVFFLYESQFLYRHL